MNALQSSAAQVNLSRLSKAGDDMRTAFQKALMSAKVPEVMDMIGQQPGLLNELISDQTPFELAVTRGFTNLASTLCNFAHFQLDAEGHEPLRICLERGQTDLALTLIEKGANPNSCDENGRSLLLLCLHMGEFELAELLLKAGAEIDCRDKRGWSALIHASFNGWKNIVEFLLEHGATVNLCTNEGWNALVVAYAYGRSEIVELLQAHGAKFGDYFAKAALLQAYKNRDLSIAKRLLALGVSVNFQYDSTDSLLSRAAQDNEWEFVEAFLNAGGNPNSRIGNKLPVISYAINQGEFEIVKLLVQKGASVNLGDRSACPIHYACERNREDIVAYLLECGACIEIKDGDGDTPLIIASKAGFYAMAKFLISKGANPEQRNKNGKRALDYSRSSELDKLLNQKH
jgi:ankyrin repeat protein